MPISDSTTRMFRSILCPVDFSPHSRTALQHALAIAGRSGGRVTALHVADPMLAAAAAAGYDKEWLTRTNLEELRDFVARVRRGGVKDVRSVRVEAAIGRPGREIRRAAVRLAADLIVVGTQGLSGIRRFVFGSVTEEVLRQASTPVLAVPRGAGGRTLKKWPGRHVVAAIELDSATPAHARRAAAVARAFGADLTFVHVLSPTPAPPWLAPRLQTEDRSRMAEAGRRLDLLVRGLDDLHVDRRVLLGDPAEEIAAAAADLRAGLTVLFLRRGHGLFGARPGSITYRVLCGTSTPVLAFPPSRSGRA